MISKNIVVTNSEGLHMRPAGLFTKAMAQFDSEVTIKFNDKSYNGKSIMNVIAACIKCGSEITVECDGPDENEAMAKAEEMLQEA
ncbi:MAG TPA: HPr family phosphocarrier protein [Firmicutes bacterium]|nr:HPr family phosphocarrier protein [Bacillota bacterium]